ncbi:alpha/beta hydrolase [Actinacidiphila sp. bgisy144]|uniref:alpha/beta hydrolase n=1 Tax=Actinacidiphila sp. bgisy144 TaxID=3413791 RepID=UPI003EBD77E4
MTSVNAAPAPAAWEIPPALGPRGTVVLLPGRGEDPLLYERFGTRLAADAYRVRAVADPSRWPREAAAQVREVLADADTVRPVVLAGSDAGALFAVGLVAAGEVAVDALLLAGLPTDKDADGAQSAEWEEELGTRTACPTHQGRLAAAERLERGALFRPLPPQWYDRAEFAKVAVPVLGLHGAADPVSPVDAARTAYTAAPRAELVTLADGRHDAFNDISHRSAAATVVLFLERLRQGADLAPIATREPLPGQAAG